MHKLQAPLSHVQGSHYYWTFLISVQPHRNTRSSSSVTISRPSSSLKITNRSFRFGISLESASCLISPVYYNQSPPQSPHFIHCSSCTSSFLPSLTPLFHSRLKAYTFFTNVFPTIDFWYLIPLDCLLEVIAFRTYYAHRFVLFSYHYFFSFWFRVVD